MKDYEDEAFEDIERAQGWRKRQILNKDKDMTHIEAMKLALRRAFNLGQTYWQQADSEYSSHWKKADVTKASFEQLVEETCQAIEQAQQAEPVAWATKEDFYRELDRKVNRMRQQMEIKSVVMRCADYDVALPMIDIREGHVLVGQVTSPPQRQPLTDGEMWKLWNAQGDDAMEQREAIAFARAIEQAHGITGEHK